MKAASLCGGLVLLAGLCLCMGVEDTKQTDVTVTSRAVADRQARQQAAMRAAVREAKAAHTRAVSLAKEEAAKRRDTKVKELKAKGRKGYSQELSLARRDRDAAKAALRKQKWCLRNPAKCAKKKEEKRRAARKAAAEKEKAAVASLLEPPPPKKRSFGNVTKSDQRTIPTRVLPKEGNGHNKSQRLKKAAGLVVKRADQSARKANQKIQKLESRLKRTANSHSAAAQQKTHQLQKRIRAMKAKADANKKQADAQKSAILEAKAKRHAAMVEVELKTAERLLVDVRTSHNEHKQRATKKEKMADIKLLLQQLKDHRRVAMKANNLLHHDELSPDQQRELQAAAARIRDAAARQEKAAKAEELKTKREIKASVAHLSARMNTATKKAKRDLLEKRSKAAAAAKAKVAAKKQQQKRAALRLKEEAEALKKQWQHEEAYTHNQATLKAKAHTERSIKQWKAHQAKALQNMLTAEKKRKSLFVNKAALQAAHRERVRQIHMQTVAHKAKMRSLIAAKAASIDQLARAIDDAASTPSAQLQTEAMAVHAKKQLHALEKNGPLLGESGIKTFVTFHKVVNGKCGEGRCPASIASAVLRPQGKGLQQVYVNEFHANVTSIAPGNCQSIGYSVPLGKMKFDIPVLGAVTVGIFSKQAELGQAKSANQHKGATRAAKNKEAIKHITSREQAAQAEQDKRDNGRAVDKGRDGLHEIEAATSLQKAQRATKHRKQQLAIGKRLFKREVKREARRQRKRAAVWRLEKKVRLNKEKQRESQVKRAMKVHLQRKKASSRGKNTSATQKATAKKNSNKGR